MLSLTHRIIITSENNVRGQSEYVNLVGLELGSPLQDSVIHGNINTIGCKIALSLSFNGHFPGKPGLAGVH